MIESSFRDDLRTLEEKVDRIEALLVAIADQRQLNPALAESQSSS